METFLTGSIVLREATLSNIAQLEITAKILLLTRSFVQRDSIAQLWYVWIYITMVVVPSSSIADTIDSFFTQTRTPLFQCRHCGEGSQEFAIIILPFILLWIFFILLYVASKWRRVLNTCRTRGGADKSFEDYSDQMIDDCEENNSSGAQIDSHSNNLDNETGRENETIDNWQEDPSGAQMDSHSSNSDNESGRENAWNGIEISARNLSLAATAKRQEKILVNDFTGTLKKGSMTAVMGKFKKSIFE